MSQTAHRPVLIVIAGPNGSGKTTITSKILRHEWLEDALYINPDQVAQDRFGDWNSPQAVLQAAQYCEEQREACLKNGQSLIFETVLSSDGKVDFIRRAHEAGYFIRIFFVSTSHPSINSSRIARRVMKGGHDVPIPKIISRYQKSILNCKRVAGSHCRPRVCLRQLYRRHRGPPAIPHDRRQALQALHRRHPPLGADHHRLSLKRFRTQFNIR